MKDCNPPSTSLFLALENVVCHYSKLYRISLVLNGLQSASKPLKSSSSICSPKKFFPSLEKEMIFFYLRNVDLAINSIFVQDEGEFQKHVYDTNKVLHDTKTIYIPLGIRQVIYGITSSTLHL